MKLRSLVITIALLALVSVAVYFARRPAAPAPADPRLGLPLVDRTTIEKAAQLRLSDQGKTVNLIRQADGSWRVASYFDLPADFQKLTGFVASLTDAKLQRLVTSSAERIARLEFKDTKIALLDSSGHETWTVTLGKNPETGGGRFVRFGTEQKAFLASLSAWLDPESKNWANAELLNLKPDTIAKVEIPFADGGPVAFSRAKKDDSWTADKTPAGHKVKADKIASVLSSIGQLRFSDTLDLADPKFAEAKAHARVFKFATFDGKTVTVSFDRKPEEKKIKPPVADAKTGGASAVLGTSTDLTAKDGKPAASPEPIKPPAPEFETIPAGPVFVTISDSDVAAPVNALMQKRAFEISDYTYTALPQKSEELFEPAPPPAPASTVTTVPAATPPAPEAPKKP